MCGMPLSGAAGVGLARLIDRQTSVPNYSGIADYLMSQLQTSEISKYTSLVWGHAVAQWLRHCATNLKVAGSIPDGVIRIFH
jgi:hypothetical protein